MTRNTSCRGTSAAKPSSKTLRDRGMVTPAFEGRQAQFPAGLLPFIAVSKCSSSATERCPDLEKHARQDRSC